MEHAGGHDRGGDPEGASRGALPSLREPRPRAERALVALIQQAYVHGVSDLLQAGLTEAITTVLVEARHRQAFISFSAATSS